MYNIEPIAYIKNDLNTKFAVPRQSNIIKELRGRIIFEKKYRNPDFLRGLEQYSHLWLLWIFSKNIRDNHSATVRPPILGGNERIGVFATRSSFRPNNIALSCVKLESIEIDSVLGPVIIVSGIDMMNDTPIIDIKPYIPKWDSLSKASGGFTENIEKRLLNVIYSEEDLSVFSELQKKALINLLKEDPRPAYQKDPERIYALEYGNYEIKFCIKNGNLYIISLQKL